MPSFRRFVQRRDSQSIEIDLNKVVYFYAFHNGTRLFFGNGLDPIEVSESFDEVAGVVPRPQR